MKEVHSDNIDHIVCTKTANYCDEEEADEEDDYNRDELWSPTGDWEKMWLCKTIICLRNRKKTCYRMSGW